MSKSYLIQERAWTRLSNESDWITFCDLKRDKAEKEAKEIVGDAVEVGIHDIENKPIFYPCLAQAAFRLDHDKIHVVFAQILVSLVYVEDVQSLVDVEPS
jgi:hypothetical protein